MKMLIEKNTLMEGINAVSRALSTRNIVPVLNGIKFDLTNEGLYLTATDNDITIQYYIDKKDIKSIDETGCTVIYGKSLLEIVRKLPNTDILIENFESYEVSFKTETAIYNFNCFLLDDFPKINLEEVKNPIQVSSMSFKELINKTSFAIALLIAMFLPVWKTLTVTLNSRAISLEMLAIPPPRPVTTIS